MIWKHASPSRITSICPSSNGHRVLVGYYDGSVRMWNLDLENLAINQADLTDTQDDSDGRRVIRMSPSGKMVITRPRRSSNVEFLNTTTREVVARLIPPLAGKACLVLEGRLPNMQRPGYMRHLT